MAREPILIGLDESPIVIQAKGTDWEFNPDPPVDFLLQMMDVAKALQAENFTEFDKMNGLLAAQLTDPHQQKLWDKSEFGFGSVTAILMAYIGEVSNLPTQPLSQSGKPRGGAGRR